ncbi:uncharacterized protein LOC122021328 isoform X1 [Zingiber officinale]|uniref:uncharacterized protein LOC122021328 isoform X1 n=1 Tax=Zingiber officinale TaxID=94328 RepID=UPI001C4AAA34|nr:uncharacterized protein LOC122021328 isoform X1 [Zingiber officinale]
MIGRRSPRILVAFLLVSVLVYDCLWLPHIPWISSVFRVQTVPKDELQQQLEGASMADKTLMIAMINKTSVDDSTLQLFLQSMRQGEDTLLLINHLLLVATDDASYKHCKILQLHCLLLSSENALISSGTALHRLFLGEVLKRGYSFIFTDVDVMWLRNPLPRLKQSADDLQISRNLENGGPSVDDSTFIYNGFCFVSSNEKTITWFTRQKGKEEEDNVLYLVKSGVDLRQQFGVTVSYLDTTYFSSLCQDELHAAKLIALHANCCPDVKAKLEGLRAVLDVWKTHKNGNSNVSFPAHSSCTQSWKNLQLKRILQGASMKNKTVIVSYLNKAYVEENGMLDLFLQSLKEGEDTAFLRKHLLLITVDEISYQRCNVLKLHCYNIKVGDLNFSKEQVYMSEGYVNLVWQKIAILREVLKHGYNFIFTDMDIIWLRNPFPKLTLYGQDMMISCDDFNGRPFDEANNINTGFFYAASNHKTKKLFDIWFSARKNLPRMNDQEVLVALKSQGVFNLLDMRIQFLDTLHFTGFCQLSNNLKEMTTMHANCCRTLRAKVGYLRESLATWKKLNGTGIVPIWPPSKACIQSWGA